VEAQNAQTKARSRPLPMGIRNSWTWQGYEETNGKAKIMRWNRKKKLQNDLTWEEMAERYNVFTYEREKFHSDYLKKALELDKGRKQDYVR